MFVAERMTETAKDTKTVYLVLLSAQSSCCGNLFQLCRSLFPEDPLQQDKYVCRLWGSLQQHCQTTIPKTAHVYFGQQCFKSSKTKVFILQDTIQRY